MMLDSTEEIGGEMPVDLLPRVSGSGLFQRLKECLCRDFCKPRAEAGQQERIDQRGVAERVSFASDTASVGFEPIIVHPYNSLKKALQGFCDPADILKPEVNANEENGCVSSLMTHSLDCDESTKLAEPDYSNRSMADETDGDVDECLVIITSSGGMMRAVRALETFLFATLIIYITFRTLRRLDHDLVEVRPNEPNDVSVFAVKKLGACDGLRFSNE